MQHFLKFILIIFILNCKETLPSLNPYNEFIIKSTDLVCKKMISCNQNFIRTFPEEEKKLVTLENCKESALVDLDKKILLHTESMKQISKSCYEKILNADCKNFLLIPFSEAKCFQLNIESNEVFTKAKN